MTEENKPPGSRWAPTQFQILAAVILIVGGNVAGSLLAGYFDLSRDLVAWLGTVAGCLGAAYVLKWGFSRPWR
jgi:hypothetical protein